MCIKLNKNKESDKISVPMKKICAWKFIFAYIL